MASLNGFKNYKDKDARDAALSRLNVMLCRDGKDAFTVDNLPTLLIDPLMDMLRLMEKHDPLDYGIQSENAENYSYTVNSDAYASIPTKIRAAYGDVLQHFSLCDSGCITNATAAPLWTRDFYRDGGRG